MFASTGCQRSAGSALATSSWRIAVYPEMTPSRLLKSCATPPASWPRLSSRRDWCIWRSMRSRSACAVSRFQQCDEPCVGPLPFGEVSDDRRHAGDRAVAVHDRGQDDRCGDDGPVLAPPPCFVAVYLAVARHTGVEPRFLVPVLLRDEQVVVAADHLVGGVPEQALGR